MIILLKVGSDQSSEVTADVWADFGCALQKEILVQGRLYVSEHHLCFYANIFGWVTHVSQYSVQSITC